MILSNPTGERGLSVLIVEDNAIFRRTFKENLKNKIPHITIQEAEEGKEALEKVESFQPKLIFMDIRMPGENGLSLTKKIKAKHPEIQVFILTSYDNPEYQEAARKSGANRFISKDDLNLEEIKTWIESISPDLKGPSH
jgi:YesN/AraC family two-component response regulator